MWLQIYTPQLNAAAAGNYSPARLTLPPLVHPVSPLLRLPLRLRSLRPLIRSDSRLRRESDTQLPPDEKLNSGVKSLHTLTERVRTADHLQLTVRVKYVFTRVLSLSII